MHLRRQQQRRHTTAIKTCAPRGVTPSFLLLRDAYSTMNTLNKTQIFLHGPWSSTRIVCVHKRVRHAYTVWKKGLHLCSRDIERKRELYCREQYGEQHLKFESGCLPIPLGTWPEKPGDGDSLSFAIVAARRERQPSRNVASCPEPMFIVYI